MTIAVVSRRPSLVTMTTPFEIGAMLFATALALSLQPQQPHGGGEPKPQTSTVTVAPFGRTPDGQAVEVYTLTNARGMQVRAITYGAIIQAIRVPDRSGQVADVTLGYDSLQGYLTDSPYFGAVVGRYANRIARGRFTLEGRTYRLATNNGQNHLHGGVKGYDKVVWRARSFQRGDTVGVRFEHTSPDGDEGYPGTVRVSVAYTLKP